MLRIFSRDLLDLMERPYLGLWLIVVPVLLAYVASTGAAHSGRVPTVIQDESTLAKDVPDEFRKLLEEIGDVEPVSVEWDGQDASTAMTDHRARLAIAWDSGLVVYIRPRDAVDRERLLGIAYQAVFAVFFEMPWQIGTVALAADEEFADIGDLLSIVDFGSPSIEASGVLMSGVIALTVAFLPFLLACSSMAREFEHGTLAGLLVAPRLGWWAIVGGKVCLAVFVTTVVFLVVLIVSFSFLGAPPRLDVLSMLAVQVPAMLTSAFLGIAASNVARSQLRAYFVSVLYVFCLIFLTGLVFPIPDSTAVVQWASAVLPLTFSLPFLETWLVHGTPADLSGIAVRQLTGQSMACLVIMLLCGFLARRRI